MTDKRNSSIVIKTLFWSIIASIMGYIINLFVTPYVTEKLGVEAYGFVTLTKTFVDYGALITTALNSYAMRFIGVEYLRGRYKEANQYYNSVLIADIFLAIFVLIFAIVFSFSLKESLNVPDNLFIDVQKLFVLSFLNFAINTVMTVFSSAAYLKNKLDVNYIFRTIGYSAEILTLLLLFAEFDTRVYYIGIAYVVDSIIILFSRIWMVKKWTPELKFDFLSFNLEAVKKLVVNGVWNSINSLGNILNTGLDLLITDLMLSATELGLIGVAKTFPTMLIMLYQLVSQPFQPLMLKCYSLEDKIGLKKNIEIAMKTSGFVTFIVFSGFVAVGRDFYTLWLPGQDANQLHILTIIALIPNAIEGIIYPAYYIYTLCVKNKIPCIITIIGGLFNVGGMYFLIKGSSLGMYAVLITTVIIMAITTYITNPLYMSKCINVNVKFFYWILIKGVISCIVMSLAMYLLAHLFVIKSWIALGLSVIPLVVIGSIIYCLIMLNNDERKLIKNKIIKMRFLTSYLF